MRILCFDFYDSNFMLVDMTDEYTNFQTSELVENR